MLVVKDIHILHVLPQLVNGGMELSLARVANSPQLRQMRHTIIVIRGKNTIPHRLPEHLKIYCLHSRPKEVLLPVRLGRLIRQLKPDVIHARNWGAWPDSAFARLLAPGVPLIYSFHGLSDPHEPLRRRMMAPLLARATTRIFTVSKSARQSLAGNLCMKTSRIGVIPNGVDTMRFCPNPARKAAARIVIGAVGNLTPVKNHTLLIDVCAGLIKQGLDIELRIAGNGVLWKSLNEKVLSLGLVDNIKMLGQVDDVAPFLKDLDIFALPSLSEANPNALLEAMASGLPCVAAKVGGVDELLDHPNCGINFPAGNADQLKQAITLLVGDPEKRSQLGTAARARVCNEYSMDLMARAYEHLYRGLAR